MSKRCVEQLTFRPASEKPTADLHGRDVLVLNPCDGWHEGVIHALEGDGEVYGTGIYTWTMKEMTPHDFYIAWALLPDVIALSNKFESTKI